MEEVNKDIIKRLRINNMIIAREVRLVGDKGEQLGIMPLIQAREVARKHDLDLVEVAPTSVPPVCRLLDYGKFKYEQAKKEQELRKSQKALLLREIRLRPKIGNHDFEAKARSARKLLADGAKVKVTIMFRGREITHPELGRKLLQRMTETLSEVASLEKSPMMYGKRLILGPITAQKTTVKEETREELKEEIKEETKEEAKEVIKEVKDAKT
ncbi:translation initiation factor IF-3 [Chloroflexota bacterium]